MIYQTDIEIMGSEYAIECEYQYYPASPGSTERGTGQKLEPDEPAMVEIVRVKMDYSEDDNSKFVLIYLPPKVIRQLEEEILENVHG